MPALPPNDIVLCDAWRLVLEPPASIEVRRRQWDDLHALSALQGLANRNGPRLYLNLVGDRGSIDRFWWSRLTARGEWLDGSKTTQVNDVLDLVRRFRRSVKGVVVWDERVPATSNLASTLAGIDNLLPVRYDPAEASLYTRLTRSKDGPRLPVRIRLIEADGRPMFDPANPTRSVKAAAYGWLADRLIATGRANPRKAGYYPDAFWLQRPNGIPVDRTLLSNHDYFIAHRGWFFDLGSWDDEAPDDEPGQVPGTDAATLQRLLHAAHARAKGRMIHVGGFTPWDLKYTDFTGMRHGGVATEWRYAEILSCFNAYMDADAPGLGPMANASFHQHFPTRPRYPQPALPTEVELTAQGHLGKNGRPAAQPFVAFYVGDYDSAAWLYRRMPDLWENPDRGKVPLGWAFNPNLADRFPVGMDHARRTASPMDAFVAGDSGAGYLNPGYLVPPRRWSGLPSGLPEWERHNRRLYKKWDIGVTGFVIDGNAPAMSDDVRRAYARFSPGGVVAQKVPAQSLVDGVPFLQMGSDLNPEDLDATARLIAAEAGSPSFRIYRTVLWSPSQHLDLVRRVHAIRPDVRFVSPPLLLELLRRRLRP